MKFISVGAVDARHDLNDIRKILLNNNKTLLQLVNKVADITHDIERGFITHNKIATEDFSEMLPFDSNDTVKEFFTRGPSEAFKAVSQRLQQLRAYVCLVIDWDVTHFVPQMGKLLMTVRYRKERAFPGRSQG